MKKLAYLPASLSSNHLLIIWIIFFCYSTVVAIIFQKLILPQIPSLHAAHGLMNNDAIYFHQVATELAESIKVNGWGAWKAWPAVGATGNVSLLAVLYVLFGPQPAVIIPVNAALHAGSGLLLLLLGVQLAGNKRGFAAGLVASTIFIIFPSALNWYGQVHKDGYVITGVLLIFYVWIKTLKSRWSLTNWLGTLACTLAGAALIGFTRPYVFKLLFLALMLIWLLNLAINLVSRDVRQRFSETILQGIMLTIILLGSVLVKGHNDDAFTSVSAVEWKSSGILPARIEGLVNSAAMTRIGIIQYNLSEGAESLIDQEIQPDSVLSVAAYLPRALQISLFAPFPTSWLEKLSIMRLVSVFEMAIWYCFVPGVLLSLWWYCTPARWICFIFSAAFLAVLGLCIPNIGTLYRIRYVYLLIVLLLGAVGWVDFFSDRLSKNQLFVRYVKKFFGTVKDTPPMEEGAGSAKTRSEVIGSGTIVILCTFLSYVGFFLRDVLIARWFGMGEELDVFIIGMMIPMFLVSVVSIPLGTAMTPFFVDLQTNDSHQAAQRFMHSVVLTVSLLLTVLCLGLYLSSPYIMPILGWNFSVGKTVACSWIMCFSLPVLFFSGVLIIGNSVLNAMNKFLITGTAQLVVPVAAISSLYCLGHQIGILSVVIGMVTGQLLNLLLIEFSLRKFNLSIIPQAMLHGNVPPKLWRQYLPLVGGGFFMGAAIPINNAMASSLDEGSVSTLGIGIKLVIFISGLVGTAITTVMIPYFSSLMAKRKHMEARRELSYFLVLATFVSVPLTLLLFSTSSQIVSLVFQGGVLQSADVEGIARVFKYGILQIPFFTCGMLFMRFDIAQKRSGIVLFASALALIVNIILNILFMQRMGAGGIALATSLSLVTSSTLLLLIFLLRRKISWYDGFLLFMSWMLFLTLTFCIHFESYVGIIVILLAYGLQICGQWKALNERVLVPIAG